MCGLILFRGLQLGSGKMGCEAVVYRLKMEKEYVAVSLAEFPGAIGRWVVLRRPSVCANDHVRYAFVTRSVGSRIRVERL